ncbi:MAG: TonB-dependent receptor [Candidatus Latescibacteria bacterium]|nr:TonB-dependent receptor [Candidatus Latescibacterota bacterium]
MRALPLVTCLLVPLFLHADRVLAQDSTVVAASDRVYVMPRVDVIGKKENLATIPGSATVLSAYSLESALVLTANEALRKLPGLAVRDEEGFGLRPNIGIRGLNPTRSTKATLLEDGIPLAYAPYGDNASYYHPPIERFELVELLKGAGQVPFGPQTIGGVINYITPTPPVRLGGFVSAAGGSRDFSSGRVRLGGHRTLLEYSRKEGEGARDNIRSRLQDVNFKTVLGEHHPLTLRANYFTESSTITYSGMTQAEFDNLGPRYNPFKNDAFDSDRFGASATHNWNLGSAALLTTNLYVSVFNRDWWRQSSTTTDAQGGPGVASARLAGNLIDPDTIGSVQGRLREYRTWGVEPRARLAYTAMGLANELQGGIKAHFERQDRRQINATSPTARTGTQVEDNLRETRAYSAFMVNRTQLGAWSFNPGLRYERIHSSRTNRLSGGASGSDALGEWIPSLGATWNPSEKVTAFTGVHRGFAPPRTEDVIASVGTVTEVEPEESTNWEIGTRLGSIGGSHVQATGFRNDFKRLIAVGSIAGGSTPLAQGEALFVGAELSGRYRHSSGFFLSGAYTWLPTAEQSTPFRQVVGGAPVGGSAAGNRQPYAPEHLLTATAGYAWHGLDAQIEAVHVGSQFADFANTTIASADGQRGKLARYTTWNAALSHVFRSTGARAFVAVKNIADKITIVDRTRGIQVGSPRLVQAGIKYAFDAGR